MPADPPPPPGATGPAPRHRRRAVGPPGARAGSELPFLELDGLDLDPARSRADEDDQQADARLEADRPPHHDRGL